MVYGQPPAVQVFGGHDMLVDCRPRCVPVVPVVPGWWKRFFERFAC